MPASRPIVRLQLDPARTVRADVYGGAAEQLHGVDAERDIDGRAGQHIHRHAVRLGAHMEPLRGGRLVEFHRAVSERDATGSGWPGRWSYTSGATNDRVAPVSNTARHLLGQHTHLVLGRVGHNDTGALRGLKLGRGEAGDGQLVRDQAGVAALLLCAVARRERVPVLVGEPLHFTIAAIVLH